MNLKGWWRIAKLAYAGAAAALLCWALYDSAGRVPNMTALLVNPGSLLFMACWVGMATALGWLWSRVFRRLSGVELPWRDWLRAQMTAWAGRYLPGKLGLFIGKSALLEKHGILWQAVGFSVLTEQMLFLLSGLCVAFTFVDPKSIGGLGHWIIELPRWLGPSLACAGVVALPHLLKVVARRVGRPPQVIPSAGQMLQYAGVHFLVGIGFWYFLRESMPMLASVAPLRAVGLLALANSSGILAFFAPAGIGVREAVIAAGLTGELKFQDALALGAALRLLTVIADVFFAAIAALVVRLGEASNYE